MTIIDKGIIRNNELESFYHPAKEDEGEFFEYKMHRKWELF